MGAGLIAMAAWRAGARSGGELPGAGRGDAVIRTGRAAEVPGYAVIRRAAEVPGYAVIRRTAEVPGYAVIRRAADSEVPGYAVIHRAAEAPGYAVIRWARRRAGGPRRAGPILKTLDFLVSIEKLFIVAFPSLLS